MVEAGKWRFVASRSLAQSATALFQPRLDGAKLAEDEPHDLEQTRKALGERFVATISSLACLYKPNVHLKIISENGDPSDALRQHAEKIMGFEGAEQREKQNELLTSLCAEFCKWLNECGPIEAQWGKIQIADGFVEVQSKSKDQEKWAPMGGKARSIGHLFRERLEAEKRAGRPVQDEEVAKKAMATAITSTDDRMLSLQTLKRRISELDGEAASESGAAATPEEVALEAPSHAPAPIQPPSQVTAPIQPPPKRELGPASEASPAPFSAPLPKGKW